MNIIRHNRRTGIEKEINKKHFINIMKLKQRNVDHCLAAIEKGLEIYTNAAIYRKGSNVPTKN